MSNLRIFLKALRLPFLTGSLLPVTVATALAYWLHQDFDPGFFCLNLSGVAGLHLGANLINGYYDSFGSDPLNVNATPFSGGSRVIQNREMKADTVRSLAYFFLAVGVVCGLALIYAGRHWVAVFGLLGLLAGFGYSASPVALMSLGVGEILIFLAFGPLLTLASYYVQTEKLAPVGAAVGLPLAFLITAIIWINEFPGLEADVAAAKRHLVSRLGLKLARWIYALLMLAPFASLVFLLEYYLLPDLIIAALVPLPLALRAIRLVWRTQPAEPGFITAQALTIQTHAFLGLTMTLALLYAAWWR